MSKVKENETIVVLDSQYATYTTNWDWSFNLSEQINNAFSIEIIDVSIPWSWGNINSQTNKLMFNDGIERTVNLINGNYDSGSILVELKRALESTNSGFTYTLSFDDITNTISISHDSDIDVIIRASSWCNQIIGLDKNDLVIHPQINKVTFPRAINLLYTTYLKVNLPYLIKSVEGKIVYNKAESCTGAVISLSGYQPWDVISLSNARNTVEHRLLNNTLNNIIVSIWDDQNSLPDEIYDYPFLVVLKVKYYG